MKHLQGAVIGLGYWGPNLVRNFIKISGVTIKIGCDLSGKTLKNFNTEYPSVKITKNVNDILMDQEIDFVAIATPLSSHFQLAKQVLEARKHVLIEKPMTQTSKEAKTLMKLAKKNNRILMVGHTFIYSDAVQNIKKLLKKKSFGQLYYFDSTRINLGRFQSDTNVIWDLAPHDLSILNYLLSDTPIEIQAMGSSHVSKKNIETADIFLTYKNGINARIHVSWLSPVKIRTVLIGGSRQMIVYNDIEPSEKVKIYNKSIILKSEDVTPFSPAYRSGSVIIPQMQIRESLYTEVVHFIGCIRNNGIPLTGGRDGLLVVQHLEAINKSIRTGKKVHILE